MNKSLVASLALVPLIVSVAAVSFFSLQVVGHAAPFNLDRASLANVSLMEADTVLGTFRPLQIRGTYPNTVVATTLAGDNGNGNGEKDGDKDEADDNDQEKGKDEGGGWDRLWDSPTLG